MSTVNHRKIAAVIVESRKNVSLYALRTALMDALGQENFQEGLRLGWIVPEYETGHLMITSNFSKLNEINSVIESDTPEVGDTVIVADDGKPYEGTVQSKNPNGTFKLTFRPTSKPSKDREYGLQEIKIKQKGESGSSAVASASPTSAPGSTAQYGRA